MSRWTPQDVADYQARRGLRVEIAEPPKRNKYSAIKTEVDGIIFDSKREATRYQDLRVMQQAGLITDLTLQPEFQLIVNGVKIAAYRGDFEYRENGQRVIEDTKSDFTCRLMWYRMKKKLMLALYQIEIRET